MILRTVDAEGDPRETRVTIIDIDGKPWIRGRPYRGWFRRLEANPEVELYRAGEWRSVRAEISRDPADAEAFHEAMFEVHGYLYLFLDVVARMSPNEIPMRLIETGA